MIRFIQIILFIVVIIITYKFTELNNKCLCEYEKKEYFKQEEYLSLIYSLKENEDNIKNSKFYIELIVTNNSDSLIEIFNQQIKNYNYINNMYEIELESIKKKSNERKSILECLKNTFKNDEGLPEAPML